MARERAHRELIPFSSIFYYLDINPSVKFKNPVRIRLVPLVDRVRP